MDNPSRLERRIQRDFPEPGSANGVIHLLDELPDVAGYGREMLNSERVRASILILANGKLADLRAAIELAKTDWRDLLVAAELANADWPGRLDEILGS